MIKSCLRNCVLNFYYYTRDKSKRSVYFTSFSGQYSDSPRAIAEELHKLDPSIRQVWEAKEGVEMPSYVEKVYTHIERLRAKARSKAWVLGMGSEWKPKDVFLVAVWHGDRGFKKILLATPKDSPNTASGKYIINCSQNIDIFTAGSDYGERQARYGLGYWGPVQKIGLPRNDKLVNIDKYKKIIDQIKSSLSIPADVKILLYAPTFRDADKGKQKIQVDLDEVMSILQKQGEKWICIIRSHTCSKGLENNSKYIMDLSNWGDMSDLLLISDCLITDYSSSAGDFVLTKRPCVLAQFDRKDYEEKSRSLWFEPDDSGFLIAKNQAELAYIFSRINSYNHEQIANKVLAFYGTHESGTSAFITAKKIMDWVNTH